MKKLYVMATVCTLILAGSGLRAQENGGQQPAADQASPHQDMMALQAAAIEAAQHLTQASGLDKATIQEQATTIQQNLQTIAKHLQDAEEHATGADKDHIAAVRAHEQEAVQHANELLTEAQKDQPEASAITMHAQAVLTHAQAANKAMDMAHGKANQN